MPPNPPMTNDDAERLAELRERQSGFKPAELRIEDYSPEIDDGTGEGGVTEIDIGNPRNDHEVPNGKVEFPTLRMRR